MSHTLTRQSSFQSRASAAQNAALATPTKVQPIRLPVVGDAERLLLTHRTARESARRSLANLAAAVLFHCEILQTGCAYIFGVRYDWLQYVDFTLSVVFLLNFMVNVYLYIKAQLRSETVHLTRSQKNLLGVSQDQEKLFPTPSLQSTPRTELPSQARTPPSYPIRRVPPPKVSPSSTPSPSYARPASSPSRTPHSPGRMQSPVGAASTARSSPPGSFTPVGQTSGLRTYSASSPYGNQMSSASSSVFMSSSFSHSPRGATPSPSRKSLGSHDDDLLNADKIDSLIKREEEKELRLQRGSQESPKGLTQSLWSYGRAAYEFIPNFGAYQLATRSKLPSSTDDGDIVQSPLKCDEMWQKLGLNRDDVAVWTENLRKWLAETVLEPLVGEISNINGRLVQMGCAEQQIGSVASSALQHLANTKAQLLPSLSAVLPYLQVTANQEYLTNRLKELAGGGCLRLYKWDSGGTHKGKPWDQDLPTDAQILIHLFCSYMDTHLPSNPRYPDGKSFSGLHFLKPSDKPADRKSALCIHQTRSQKPYFKVLVEDNVYDIPQGRNNLFHALAVFLYFVRKKHHGMLERVNLGISGINVLWILDKK